MEYGPVAIVIAHGMGQQIPFQTLDDVAEGLRRQDRKRRKGKPPMPIAKTVELGGERLARLELKILTRDGERDVHLYESYWAPMTEGRVTLRDVMGFLLRAGVGALRLARRPFKRWLFGEYEKYPVPLLTVICLALSIGVVLALTWLSIVIVVVAGAKVPLRDVSPWLTETRFRDITTVFNVHVSRMAPFVLLMIWWGLTQPASAGMAVARGLWTGGALHAWRRGHGGAGGVPPHPRRRDRLVLRACRRSAWLPGLFPDWFSNVSWVLVVGATALVRWFLIQYVGDVAAYVQPQVIDRFYELRKEIKKCVWTTANAVYREEEYRDIIMVGHSLGSVVAYDVLNLLLIDHKLKPGTCPRSPGAHGCCSPSAARSTRPRSSSRHRARERRRARR